MLWSCRVDFEHINTNIHYLLKAQKINHLTQQFIVFSHCNSIVDCIVEHFFKKCISNTNI